MQISGHTNMAFINNYSTLSEERHKKISNILSNTETSESETNRNAFQQTYLVKPSQILQPVALLMFIFFMRLENFLSCTFLPVSKARTNKLCFLRQCKFKSLVMLLLCCYFSLYHCIWLYENKDM
jgi:hypothetical protein